MPMHYSFFIIIVFVVVLLLVFTLQYKKSSSKMKVNPFVTLLALLAQSSQSFTTTTPSFVSSRTMSCRHTTLAAAAGGEPDDPDLQWNLYQKYHARGSWKGIWTTYDYIGDVLDEAVASVDLESIDDTIVQQTHQIVVGAKRSDCATCFDSMETKSIPVAQYTRDSLAQRNRLAANSMVTGPTLTRSGLMATELVLAQDDARVRVVFQHAPVWERGVEPGSCPPQGLKLARCLISREALRDMPPTAETEAALSSPTSPRFYRPVPPYMWHKKWEGTSWTWGPSNGNRGWSIDDLPKGDDWHGSAPVEGWNLRLPGGVFVQCPRIITDAEVGLCRLAWLVNDETLLRVEAGVTALQPLFLDDESVVGFEPPSLTSLRCDILNKAGDLEGEPMFARGNKSTDGVITPAPESSTGSDGDSDSIKAIRDAMSL